HSLGETRISEITEMDKSEAKEREQFIRRFVIEKEKFYQYLFFHQWFKLKDYCNKKSIKLIGDIPIYVSYDSVDVWRNPEIFKLDKELNPVAVSGVPPDYFSSTGQLWNNPVYNWDKLESSNFEWWIKRIKVTLSRFDIVRIDHFRGLVKYWEIPAGEKTAINGRWVPVPSYKFFDTIKKEISNLSFIAEDLGFITEDVHQVLNHYGFPGMKILLFAFGEKNPFHPYLPHMYGRNCVVYTGTHDNNTVRGWFEDEASEEEKERFFRYTGITKKTIDSVVKTFIRLAQSSVADISIIPLQDWLLLDSSARMNKPSIPEGNWEWRMTEKQLKNLPVEEMAEMTELYGRLSK
ncbi:MAG: 4-alpha-glucanotransferase, partial [Chitinispirillaceae bacterium]|nr:4-alpha-glucanotransferase [Chitinispirillaceae bacterium]